MKPSMLLFRFAAWICLAWVAAAGAQERVLDDFASIASWKADASNDVRAALRAESGADGPALCLDFDFGQVSGYAIARRELPLEFGPNYELGFDVRGDAQPNTLQFKLVDTSGENVWWINRPDFAFSRAWQSLRFKKRHVEFAWGPTPVRTLTKTAAVEFVVASGKGGGKGSVCFRRLAMRSLPVDHGPAQPVVAHASSALADAPPALALDADPASAWSSDPAAGREQTFTLDFGGPREFGGLVLHWLAGRQAARYSVDVSDDGAHWRTVREVKSGGAGPHALLLPDTEARGLRLRLHDGPAGAYALARVDIKSLAWGASPNAFFTALARVAPRGRYPRGFSGEQVYWTVIGIDGGRVQGLMSEDGAIEPGPGLPALEPMLKVGDRILTWADAKITHTLAGGDLPIPSVRWWADELELVVTGFGRGMPGRSQLVARYDVVNRSARPRRVDLVLALRPFQANPPTQFLNTPGGVASIRALAWDGRALMVNGQPQILPLTAPDAVPVRAFDAGDVVTTLDGAGTAAAVEDDTGFASGALVWRLNLPAGGRRSVGVLLPLEGEPPVEPATGDATRWLDAAQREVAAAWNKKLDRLRLRGPAAALPLARTLRTAQAHILINRNGPALQPGTRSYRRSWIRDGALTGEALLRTGHADVARDFARWFAPHQFANGKVPCCVDARGADPVPENDSQGEFIRLVGQVVRHTGDLDFGRVMWPHVAAAVDYMEVLRAQERGARNATPQRQAYFGLMPPSISHEGYSDKPAYSYWDDFFALAGYTSAVDLARALGRNEDAARFDAMRTEFARDLYASIDTVVKRHGLDVLPASADRADFDPTSSTIALAPADAGPALPAALVHNTFERYWRENVSRHARADWKDYTPYEWRTVGSFVRLGWRERAQVQSDFFFADQRPAGWNQWAEVVGRDPREQRFLGDMPHGWVASDFIRATLDRYAYERSADHALVLAAGIPAAWLDGQGIGIEGLSTPWGSLAYTLARRGGTLTLELAAGSAVPPGGVWLAWPYAEAPRTVHIDGQRARLVDGMIRIDHAPARLSATLAQPPR